MRSVYDNDNYANQSQNKCYNSFSMIIAEQCLNSDFQLLKSIKDEEKSLFDEKTALAKLDSRLKVITDQQKRRLSKKSQKPRTSEYNDKIEAQVKWYEDEIARLTHSIASRSSKISLLKVMYDCHIALEGMRTISSYVRLENNRLMFIETPFFALIPRYSIVWVELNREEKMNCSSFSKNAVSTVNVNSSVVYEGVINNAGVANQNCILSINLKQMVTYKIGENVVLNVTNPQKYVPLRVSNKALSKSEINVPGRVGSSQQRRNVVIIVRRWGLNIPKAVEIDATGDNYSEIVSGNVQFGDQVFLQN
jgi:hypothetical protein